MDVSYAKTSRAVSNCSSVSVPAETWPRSTTTSRIVLFSFSACLAMEAASSYPSVRLSGVTIDGEPSA